MIFYDCSTAPSPRRARMFIREKGIEVETRNINIGEGEQFSAAFLAVNPGATVPALVTDEGVTLAENTGIAAYLEAQFPEPPLMGRTAEEKGLVAMWNSICETQCGWAIAEALRNGNPRMAGRALPGPQNYEQIPELAERGKARLAVFFDVLEDRLQSSPYLASDAFTFADITGYVFVSFARVVKMGIPDGNTASKAWFDTIAARPSAAF